MQDKEENTLSWSADFDGALFRVTLWRVVAFILIFYSLDGAAQSREETAVANAVESLRQALIEGKREALSAITADELSYGHSGGKIEDKTTFIERLVTGDSDFKSIELREQTITVTGDVAMVRHRLLAETSDNGVPGEVTLSVLLIWHKRKEGWKLLARQAVKVP